MIKPLATPPVVHYSMKHHLQFTLTFYIRWLKLLKLFDKATVHSVVIVLLYPFVVDVFLGLLSLCWAKFAVNVICKKCIFLQSHALKHIKAITFRNL